MNENNIINQVPITPSVQPVPSVPVAPNVTPNVATNVQQPVPSVPITPNIQQSVPNATINPNVQQTVSSTPVMPNVQQPVPSPAVTPTVQPSAPIVQPVAPTVAPTATTVPQAMSQPNVAAAPQVVEDVQPVSNVVLNNVVPTEQPDVQASVVQEVQQEQASNDTSDVTFDYNALYGIQSKDIETIQVEEEKAPVFTTQDIVIEDRSLNNRVINDITPEFNADALEGTTQQTESNLTDKVLSEKQQDKADTRRKILFIGVLVLLIVVFLKFIFPIIAGYNL